MKTPKSIAGLTILCLMLLQACSGVRPSPAPVLFINGCPAVIPCSLPASRPLNNGQLGSALMAAEAAWAECAAQVDMIEQCQTRIEQERARVQAP